MCSCFSRDLLAHSLVSRETLSFRPTSAMICWNATVQRRWGSSFSATFCLVSFPIIVTKPKAQEDCMPNFILKCLSYTLFFSSYITSTVEFLLLVPVISFKSANYPVLTAAVFCHTYQRTPRHI